MSNFVFADAKVPFFPCLTN